MTIKEFSDRIAELADGRTSQVTVTVWRHSDGRCRASYAGTVHDQAGEIVAGLHHQSTAEVVIETIRAKLTGRLDAPVDAATLGDIPAPAAEQVQP